MKTEIYYIGLTEEARKDQSSEMFKKQRLLMADIHANSDTIKEMAREDEKYLEFYKRVADKEKLVLEAVELGMYKKFAEIDLPEGEKGAEKAFIILQNAYKPHPYGGRSMMIGDIVVQGEKAYLCTSTWLEMKNPFM